MQPSETSVVTGAFSYTGRYIARRLLSMGKTVKTLTGHPDSAATFEGKISAAPYNFDNPGELTRFLEGVDVLYNTYWIRFPKGELTHDKAVENSRALIKSAEDAGVRRIVHVSVTNASVDSPLPYFKGKAQVEEAVMNSNLSYAIIRPALTFGKEDILINNIAWTLKRFPFFTMFGSGDYQVQPVYVEDMAELAVNLGQQTDNVAIDAVGPDVFTFEELVRLIADSTDEKARLIHMRPGLALFLAKLVGLMVRDVTLTRDEIDGLMAGLLVSDAPPTGHTRLSNWLEQHAATLGTAYVSELERHYK